MHLTKNHLLLKSELTGDYLSDRRKIMEALSTGSFYFSVDLLGDPTGFYFDATIGKKSYLPGSTVINPKGPVTLTAELPEIKGAPYEIVLLRNGNRILSVNESKMSYLTTEPGNYRVMVRVIPTLPLPDAKKWFPWIFSNAIRIQGKVTP